MTWRSNDLIDLIANRLEKQSKSDDLEQAVYGFDSWKELDLHPLIREGLAAGGYGVWAEQRYPSDWNKARKNEGIRCDMVLTEEKKPLRDPELEGTLFGAHIDSVDPEDAYWLEVKVVCQFKNGVSYKNYAHDLMNPVRKDILKLWGEGRLRHGGLLLILFAEDQETAERDLLQWYVYGIGKNLPIHYPSIRGFSVTERTGNAWCGIGMFDVRRL